MSRCVHAALGANTLKGQKDPFILLSEIYSDFCIMDSQAAQTFVSNSVFADLEQNEFKDYPVQYIYYTKKKESQVPGKASIIQEVLEAMFSMGTIKVHWSLTDVVRQILREHPGFDFLDGLQMMRSSLELDYLDAIEDCKTSAYRDKLKEMASGEPEKRQSNVVFKTTGY